jgi:hypothetical protein
MSKLAKNLTLQPQADFRAPDKLSSVDVKWQFEQGPWPKPVLQKAHLSVNIQRTCWIHEHSISKKDDNLNDTIYDLKRAVVEEVFGEFRPMLMEMRAALHDRDTTKLRELLIELETKMFVDGL